MKAINFEKLLYWSAVFAIACSILLALPALLIPLGLLAEADAVDYRVPILQWMLRHHAYPSWNWTMVDDYPMLGELLMLPLYAVKPGLARLVPIAAYIGAAFFSGRILADLVKNRSSFEDKTIVLVGMAIALGFKPLLLQSNLFMVDNIASFGVLAALSFALRKKYFFAGIFGALAMATRYTTWPMIGLFSFLPFFLEKENRIKACLLYGSLALLGALPFMVRNFLLNGGHPFFPIGTPVAEVYSGYGRGVGIKALLFLPYDLLYTNTFVSAIFDYPLGAYFYLQLSLFLLAIVSLPKLCKNNLVAEILCVFVFIFTIIWFFSAQQLRFLVPALLVCNMFMVATLLKGEKFWLLAFLVFIGTFSSLSTQKGALLLAFHKTESYFAKNRDLAESCLARAGVGGSDLVAHMERDGTTGFLNRDFYFVAPHSYAIPQALPADIQWIYAPSLPAIAGFEPWPKESPCILKKKSS